MQKDFLFRFSAPRQYQKEMMQDIYGAVSRGQSILVNAPTGIGKTDAAIGATLTYALKNSKDIFFLTPKISQHKIAIEALRGIKEKFGVDVRFVDVVGKQNMCANPEINMITGDAFYAACDGLVKRNKCSFFTNSKSIDGAVLAKLSALSLQGHNSVFNASYDLGLCPYEATARIAKNANVIIAGYSHILNPYTKQTFLRKIGKSLDNAIIIWDESHNLIDIANSYFSVSLTNRTIDLAQAELSRIGSSIDLSYMKFGLSRLRAKMLAAKSESFIGMDDLSMVVPEQADISDDIEKAGIEYISQTKAKRSSLMHIVKFITSWYHESESSVRIISKMSEGARLSVNSIYPEESVAILKEAFANVFMSATLDPTKMYADLFSSGSAVMKSYKSPFPEGNRMAFIDESVTTKYESRSVGEYRKIAERIDEISSIIPGNTAVFFPSFDVMEGVYRYMRSGNIYRQHRNMKSLSIDGVLEKFKNGKNGILFGVAGGSLSEGIDYENNSIKCVIIVGIPLSRPNLLLNAKINYFTKKFGQKGSDYAYFVPAIIKSIQAAGRAIRNERDRAVLIFMDKRYGWGTYYSLVSNSVKISEIRDYAQHISDFWKKSAEARISEGNK